MPDVAHVNGPPVTKRVVALVGGRADGARCTVNNSVVQVPYSDRSCEVYRMERYYVRWPVPGWELRIVADVRDLHGVLDVYWLGRVLATEQRHTAILEHLPKLNAALHHMTIARMVHADAHGHESAEQLVRHEVDELVRLTTPGYEEAV